MCVDIIKWQIDLYVWVGIVFGLVLFVVFFVGVINMFYYELYYWQEFWVVFEFSDVNMQVLLDMVIVRNLEVGNWMFLIFGDEFVVIWQEMVDGEVIWYIEYVGDFNDVGEVVECFYLEFVGFINELYFWFGIFVVGLYLMGVILVFYGVVLIGGLVIYWLKMKKEFFVFKYQGNLCCYWKNLYNLVGVISFLFYFIFVVIGVVMGCFVLFILILGVLVFGLQFQGVVIEVMEVWFILEVSGNVVIMVLVDVYLVIVCEQFLELEVGWIELQQYGDENVVVDVVGFVFGVVVYYVYVVMCVDDVELLMVFVFGVCFFNYFLLFLVYLLYFGDYGGLFVCLFYFVLGLLGCLLFVFGNIMWSE